METTKKNYVDYSDLEDWHKVNSITFLVFKHKNKVNIVILPKVYHMVS